jgi:hypothetical protein
MSNENIPTWLLRRQAMTDQADQIIAEAFAQIKRADELLRWLRMQPVGRRIRSSSQPLSLAS